MAVVGVTKEAWRQIVFIVFRRRVGIPIPSALARSIWVLIFASWLDWDLGQTDYKVKVQVGTTTTDSKKLFR